MCIQNLLQYTCTHRFRGGLVTCGAPSLPGHRMNEAVSYVQVSCPVCSFRYLPTPGSFSSFIPQPPPVIFMHGISTQPYPRGCHPYNALGFIPPGNVPAYIPREIRYEMIRGVLTPVEHFRAADIGMEGRRGWNDTYGFDDGHASLPVNSIGLNPVHGADHGPPPPRYDSGPLLLEPSNNASIPTRVQENVASSSAAVPARATLERIGNDAVSAGNRQEESRDAQEGRADTEAPTHAILSQEREGSDVISISSGKVTKGSGTSMVSSTVGESSMRGSQSARTRKPKRVKISDDVEFVEPDPDPDPET